jgi:hypothetical protein
LEGSLTRQLCDSRTPRKLEPQEAGTSVAVTVCLFPPHRQSGRVLVEVPIRPPLGPSSGLFTSHYLSEQPKILPRTWEEKGAGRMLPFLGKLARLLTGTAPHAGALFLVPELGSRPDNFTEHLLLPTLSTAQVCHAHLGQWLQPTTIHCYFTLSLFLNIASWFPRPECWSAGGRCRVVALT